MKINESQVMFNAQHSKQTTQDHLQSSTNIGPPNSRIEQPIQGVIDLSYNAQMRAEDETNVEASSRVESGLNQSAYQKSHTTHAITQTSIGLAATVQNIAINDNHVPLLAPAKSIAYSEVAQLNIQTSNQANRDSMNPSAQISIKEQYSFSQDEQLHVGTQGRVTTQDGREIDFMLQLDMNRSFALEESLHIQRSQRQLMDPLVINLNGGAASLTSHSFSFDLNADGKEEQISFVGSGSGFLAIDNNGDGRINDGSELFGTGSKDGFSDLAQYDLDNNKWIDENDDIFNKLKVWTKDASGQDHLISLKDAGVGAIYLGSASSSFDLRDAENNLLGQVKRSGVFLTERGEVASIQEIDIAIREDATAQITHKEGIELQISDWRDEQPAINNQRLNLDINVANEPIFEQKDDLPTLIDILFPTPGSKYDYSSKVYQASHSEINTTTLSSKTTTDIVTPQANPTIFIDQSSLLSLQDLGNQTQTQIDVDQEKFTHLKAIIESLHKQHTKQYVKDT